MLRSWLRLLVGGRATKIAVPRRGTTYPPRAGTILRARVAVPGIRSPRSNGAADCVTRISSVSRGYPICSMLFCKKSDESPYGRHWFLVSPRSSAASFCSGEDTVSTHCRRHRTCQASVTVLRPEVFQRLTNAWGMPRTT